jgi:hypothetical protein
VTLLEERSREEWQWAALESIFADLKLTLRRLRKSPGFAITVLLTIALGIGANTTVFSVIDRCTAEAAALSRCRNRLAALTLNAPGAEGMADFSTGLRLSPSMYLTFSEHNRTFQSLGVWTTGTANVTGVAQPEEVQTALVSGGVLETLGVLPKAGRWFSAD